mgnify:FL=1|tara:strand:+ start:166 stop:456 length:291 start_codon:yes stop_codon:yes gene_type:complete
MPGKYLKKLLKKVKPSGKTYKIDGKVVQELPDGRAVSKQWVKDNPGRSLKGTKADFEVSWANYLREKGLVNQNPGKVKNWKPKKSHGGAVGPNGVL